MLQIQLNIDCEGPLALNDSAFELCREFIQPAGGRFFTQVSRYGTYLAQIANQPDGAALKLILPFLKAHGLTNETLLDFCSQHLRLLSGAEAAYKFLRRFGFPIFAHSIGYRQFAAAVGSRLGFAAGQVFGMDLDLDRFAVTAAEAEELGRLEAEIAASPDLELPPGAGTLADLPETSQEAVATLDRIFQKRLPELELGAIYREVQPVGGPEKAKAVKDSLAATGRQPAEVIYVGDGASDVQAFEAVRAGGGLTISFNGNGAAVKAAEIVVVADSAWPVALLVAIFRLWGKDGVLEVAAPETRGKSRALVLPEEMIEPIATGLEGRQFNLYMSNNPILQKIIRESEAMRARLRGEAIAAQG